MRNRLLTGLAITTAAVALGGWGYSQTQTAPKSVTGEVIDLNCYMDHGAHGDGHKACGVNCAKAGNPIGILTKDGKVYLMLAGDRHEPGSTSEKLIDKMAETVTVSGKVVKKGGMEAVIVESVK